MPIYSSKTNKIKKLANRASMFAPTPRFLLKATSHCLQEKASPEPKQQRNIQTIVDAREQSPPSWSCMRYKIKKNQDDNVRR